MESDNLLTLTEDQWRAIEKINDTLASQHDLPQALRIGLDLLLRNLGRPGAALYLPRFCEHVTEDWTFDNIPPAWETSLDDHAGPLRQLVDQAVRTGQIEPGSASLETGAVFPVIAVPGGPHADEALADAAPRVIGALLVRGPVIVADEYARWQAFLRPFARAVCLHNSVSGNRDGLPSYLDLMRSRNTLRAMFDSLPISIYIIDNAYNVSAINYSRSDRVGEKPNQIVGRKCYEKLHQRTSPCAGCRVGETFATGENTSRVNRSWINNDKFIEWEISTYPIFDEQNFVHQTIIVEQDVTEKRNLESNLIQSEKLAAVGQLAAGVAHEINNPLTAIIANAQILRREIPAENVDQLDSVNLIELAGTRASQVVRNLLGIARKEKYELEPTDLNETLQNALTLVQHELVGRPIHVRLDLAEHLPQVLASQDQLQGVWINLILNAIDALDKDNGEISVTSRCTGQQLEVSIMDNGKGIPPDYLARVFEPFFTTKSPGRGTGLGLSVCMRVVRHHGGNIQVESQIDRWTRFTVFLPAVQAENPSGEII